jgi:hypothetical protein
MSEQSGTGRYPKPPASPAWEGSDFDAADPKSGDMGGGWESGGEGGDPTSGEIAKPNPGSTFSGK